MGVSGFYNIIATLIQLCPFGGLNSLPLTVWDLRHAYFVT